MLLERHRSKVTKRETVLGIVPLKCQEKLFMFGGAFIFFLNMYKHFVSLTHAQVLNLKQKRKNLTGGFQRSLLLWLLATLLACSRPFQRPQI